ncbi:MAG: hypothetical protein ACK4OO_05085, partial [bacterium]
MLSKSDIIKTLARNRGLFKFLPLRIRDWGKRIVGIQRLTERIRSQLNPLVGTRYEWEYNGDSPFRLGIIYDNYHYHQYYMFACHDMGISYRVIDIRTNDWIEKLKRSECQAFLVWPLLGNSVLKEMTDERIKIMSEELGYIVYPSFKEIWLLDNKRRTYHWLRAKQFPTPQFWDFYELNEAIEFIKNAEYPIVFKSVHGGVSSGVIICRSQNEAKKLVQQCFKSGFIRRGVNNQDRQWGYIFFQEYLKDVEEHRLIRIGGSYINIQKIRRGDFHSGSGIQKWGVFREDLFLLAQRITNEAKFESMSIDIFETPQCSLLVNELHSVSGGPLVPPDEHMGRYLFNDGKWIFEKGNFYRNYCSNLRVE